MKRSWTAIGLATLALAVSSARPAAGALEVAVTVSPTETMPGRPVEVLLRTFAPFGRGSLHLPPPSLAYPAPSGMWNVLYPVADYPFDVVATAEGTTDVAVPLARDAADASLWRGSFTPPSAGRWTIRVRNFPAGSAGASATLTVSGGAASDEALPLVAVVIGALVAGSIGGFVLGRGGRGASTRAEPPRPLT